MDWQTRITDIEDDCMYRLTDLPAGMLLPRSVLARIGWSDHPEMPFPGTYLRRFLAHQASITSGKTSVIAPRVSARDAARLAFWAQHLGMTRTALFWACAHRALPSPVPVPNQIGLYCLRRLRCMMPPPSLIDRLSGALTQPRRLPAIPTTESIRHLSLRVTALQREKIRVMAEQRGRDVSGLVHQLLRQLDDFPYVPKLTHANVAELLAVQLETFSDLERGLPLDHASICVRLTALAIPGETP